MNNVHRTAGIIQTFYADIKYFMQILKAESLIFHRNRWLDYV